MREETDLSRRRFLTITFWVGLLPFIQPTWAQAASVERMSHTSLSSRLAKLLRHKESARIIGLEYLRTAPHEADEQTLVDLIALDFPHGYKAPRNGDTAKLRKALGLRVRQDFGEGQIVKLQGWIVSVTEARLCALVALA